MSEQEPPAGATKYLDLVVGEGTLDYRQPFVTGLPTILRALTEEDTTFVARIYDTEAGLIAVLADLAQERARQDAKWGGIPHDDQHTLYAWAALLDRYLVKIYDLLDPNESDDPFFLDHQEIRARALALGALSCAMVEAIDRQRPGIAGG